MENQQHEQIQQFGEFTQWYQSLLSIAADIKWHSPVKEGKWCIVEIITHLLRWDEYLLSRVLPDVVANGKIEFPNHDAYNAGLSRSALIGSPITIVNQAIVTRDGLMQKLSEMTEEEITRPITVNGYSHCPQTNTPYSLSYLILEFNNHDQHHRNQVEEFLSARM